MMRKKIQKEEENLSKDQNKGTEIKADSTQLGDNGGGKSEMPSSDESVKASSDNGSNGASVADKVVTELRALEEKLAEMQDKYIRLSAEFDNYRKRTLREKMDLSKYAGENLLLSIIPLMDDFDRAMKHMDNATDCAAMKSGIDLIYNKFSDFLKQNGVKEIESLDNNFNVDLHEAVAKVQVEEEKKKGKVIDVVLKGYYLQDKVLRFSKVVVGE